MEGNHNTRANDVENNRQKRRQTSIWSRLLFQRIFIFSIIRLCVYINKVYQDAGSVKKYYEERAFYFGIISVLSLVSPSIIYAIYLSFETIIKANSNERFAKTVTTKFVNGLLLVPWQIKRHLDGLYFASERLCSFRPGKPDEMENVACLSRSAEVLEFFEDFYAGFLQILLQLYLLSLEVNNLLDKNLFLAVELGSSVLSVFSMLIAIRRRDDGILTGMLSFIGWISMFTSRVVVFALALTLFRVWFVPFFVVHAVGFSIWVYNIAVESHNEATDTQVTDNPETRPVQKNRFHLAILVFLFFGLPSLVLWPIMFQLKEKKRPLVFLFVNTVENAVLLVVWYFCKSTNSPMDMYSLLVVVIGTLVADLFLSGYILCKPKLTDQVVLHDMRYQDTESFGIYYEFCDIVFRLKVRRQFTEELEEVRKSLGTSTHNG